MARARFEPDPNPCHSPALFRAVPASERQRRRQPACSPPSVAVLIVCVLGSVLAASTARGQLDFQRTVVVDPKGGGSGNYTTIQSAINAIPQGLPSVRWTVLIMAGVYGESVTLGSGKNDIDLVGVDRDAVVIKAPENGDALTITSSGNNTIRNLTLIGDDPDQSQGRGIVIGGGGSTPAGVRLEDLLIRTEQSYGDAIKAESGASGIDVIRVQARCKGFTSRPYSGAGAMDVRIVECDFRSEDGESEAGSRLEIRDSSIVIVLPEGSVGQDDTAAVNASGTSGLTIVNSRLRGRQIGLELDRNVTDVLVEQTDLGGANYGVPLQCGDRVLFRDCRITADSTLGFSPSLNDTAYWGVAVRGRTQDPACSPGAIRFENCTISSAVALAPPYRTAARDAIGIEVAASPSASAGPVQVVECVIRADAGLTANKGRYAYGIRSAATSAVAVTGGAIFTSSLEAKQETVFDVLTGSTTQVRALVTGTAMSTWSGAVGASERPRIKVQRMAGLTASADNGALGAQMLTGSEQTIQSGFTMYGGYRVLSAKGNQAGMNQTVYIRGLDWGGRLVTDVVQLNGTSAVAGVKPIRQLTLVILPAGTSGQTVSIGTTDVLGLYAPITNTTDVLHQARKGVNTTDPYVFETVGAINVQYGTVNVGTITTNQAIELTYNASE